MYTYGVDIASFQGNPIWTEVKAAGYRFAYVKTTQFPRYLNPYAITQRQDAFQHGFQVGNYCYAVAKLGDPVAQAHWFLSRSDIQRWHLAPILDLEESGSEGVSPKDLEAFAYTWAEAVTGFLGIKKCILYSDLNMLRNRVLVTRRLRSIFMLDVADWTLGPPPKVPGWNVVFHQYNTSAGIPGFTGPVDHMRALVPLSSLTVEALKTKTAPKPTKPPCTTVLQRTRARLRI